MSRQARDWDELAELDPLWAVLSDPARMGGRWDSDEFFATGEGEVSAVLDVARDLGRPARTERALDFGCGVGRLTRALAARFRVCVGVDASARMIEHAREANAGVANCCFVANDAPDLRRFDDSSFDLVLSSIVLQHLPDARSVERYVEEFVRVVRPDGLAVFQLPDELPARYRLQPRRRAYALLRAVGVPRRVLFERARLSPIRMTGLAPSRVGAVVASAGGRVLRADDDASIPPLRSLRYYVVRNP